MQIDRGYSSMQFGTMQTIFVLVVVYAIYVGIYVVSPAPLYAVSISSVLFLGFGTVVWYTGFKYGTYRAMRAKSGRVLIERGSKKETGPSE